MGYYSGWLFAFFTKSFFTHKAQAKDRMLIVKAKTMSIMICCFYVKGAKGLAPIGAAASN